MTNETTILNTDEYLKLLTDDEKEFLISALHRSTTQTPDPSLENLKYFTIDAIFDALEHTHQTKEHLTEEGIILLLNLYKKMVSLQCLELIELTKTNIS